jgi:hypothetical protein
MFKFETEAQQTHRACRTRIMAAMETGNFDVARTVLREYNEVAPDGARSIRTELVGVYGTGL